MIPGGEDGATKEPDANAVRKERRGAAKRADEPHSPPSKNGRQPHQGPSKSPPEEVRDGSGSPVPWARLLRYTVDQSRAVPGLHPEDRDDASQEALIGYYRACERGDHIDNPKAYLNAALHRQAGKRARARRVRKATLPHRGEDLESVVASPLPVQGKVPSKSQRRPWDVSFAQA